MPSNVVELRPAVAIKTQTQNDLAWVRDHDRTAVIKRIKEGLQKRSGKTWSVTGGTGTAYGWLKISVPPKRLGCARLCNFTTFVLGEGYDICACCGQSRFQRRESACPKHVCNEKCYENYITPEDRAELAKLLGKETVHVQGESIPASSEYRAEYIARAEGREPEVHGTQYWD